MILKARAGVSRARVLLMSCGRCEAEGWMVRMGCSTARSADQSLADHSDAARPKRRWRLASAIVDGLW